MRSVASVGRWSTRHPWWAIAAWLAFVVLAVAAAIAGGTEELVNGAVGESARGYSMMDRYRAWPPTREYAYLHSETLRANDREFRAATAAARARTRLCGRRQGRDAHLARPTCRPRDRHRGTARPPRRAPQHGPRRRSGAPADHRRADRRHLRERGPRRRGQPRPPPRRAPLDPGHADRAAVRVRRHRRSARARRARPHRRDRRLRVARPTQPGLSDRRRRQDGDAADRDGGRRRLCPVLRHPLARGAASRAALARGTRAARSGRRAEPSSSRARLS